MEIKIHPILHCKPKFWPPPPTKKKKKKKNKKLWNSSCSMGSSRRHFTSPLKVIQVCSKGPQLVGKLLLTVGCAATFVWVPLTHGNKLSPSEKSGRREWRGRKQLLKTFFISLV